MALNNMFKFSNKKTPNTHDELASALGNNMLAFNPKNKQFMILDAKQTMPVECRMVTF